MTARSGRNLTRLRASVKAAAPPASDSAGVQLATRLAALLDQYADTGEDEVQAYKLLGPLYLRCLNELGLTKGGRGVGDTKGTPGGVSADVAARDRLRAEAATRWGAGSGAA